MRAAHDCARRKCKILREKPCFLICGFFDGGCKKSLRLIGSSISLQMNTGLGILNRFDQSNAL